MQRDATGHFHGPLYEYFRKISLIQDDGSSLTDSDVILVRMSKKRLKSHLSQYYGSKLVDKILRYFEFKKDLSFEQYLLKLEHLFQRPNLGSDDQIRAAKEFTF